MSEKFKYLVMGAVLGVGILLLSSMAGKETSAAKEPANPVGTYQVAAAQWYYVVIDTRSGEVANSAHWTGEAPSYLERFAAPPR
jgi:hypothetical protein